MLKGQQHRASIAVIFLIGICNIQQPIYSTHAVNVMLTIGPPSGKPRGCLACRAMKVKCDRAFPHCERCQKRRKPCPGYAGEASVTFRSMNQYAETKVKARTTGRDKSATPQELVFHRDFSPLQRKISIPTGLDTDWRALAIPRFFEDHGRVTHPDRDCSLHFLKQVLQENRTEAYLTDAVKAVALTSLANQTGLAWLDVEARQAYGRAIHGAAMVLHCPPQAKNDALLAATFLFGFFEVLSTKPAYKFWDSMHERGRISLLRLRGEDQFETEMGKYMFGVIYTQHILKCILMHLEPPQECEEWIAHFEQDEHKNLRWIGRLNLRCARMCAEAQVLFDSPTQDDDWVLRMLQVIKTGLQLDDDYHSWGNLTSTAEDYKIKRLKPSVPTDGNPILIYNDLLVAWLWDNMRTVRIHLLEVLKHSDYLLRAHHNAAGIEFESTGLEEDANAIIRDMVSDVCATVPFFLGEVNSRGNISKYPHKLPLAGRMATWSIYIAMVSSEPGSETEAWLRSKLEFINSSMGIRLAARLARRERKNPWDIR